MIKKVYHKAMSAVVKNDWPVGETLSDLRNESGKTTYQVADAMGLTQPRISQIDNIGTKDIDQIELLAAIYGVPKDRVEQAAKNTRLSANNR